MKLVMGNSGSRDLPEFETVLITRLLETGDIKTAIKRKMSEDFFVMPQARTAYTYLVGHYQEYGTTPSKKLFEEEFPDFEFQGTLDSVAAICDHLKNNKLYRDLSDAQEEAVRITRDNPKEALAYLRGVVATLTTQHVMTRDLDITNGVKELRAEYQRAQEGKGMLGIPWPWPKMNETTLGIQNEELIFIYARPKSLKTWQMINTGIHAFKLNRKVLMFTLEMAPEQMQRRAAAIWAKVDYAALRKGQLTKSEEIRYFEDLEALSENKGFIISGGDESHGTGITSIAAKIQEYDPDLVLVDGVYLMHDDRGGKRSSDWQAIAHLTQDLKGLARRAQIPIIGTTQANRSGEKTKGTSLSEMAFGDGFVMDCDYVIRIIRDQKEIESNEAILTLPGIREAPGCTFTVNTLLASDMSQKHVAETEDEVKELLAGTDEGSGTVIR